MQQTSAPRGWAESLWWSRISCVEGAWGQPIFSSLFSTRGLGWSPLPWDYEATTLAELPTAGLLFITQGPGVGHSCVTLFLQNIPNRCLWSSAHKFKLPQYLYPGTQHTQCVIKHVGDGVIWNHPASCGAVPADTNTHIFALICTLSSSECSMWHIWKKILIKSLDFLLSSPVTSINLPNESSLYN